MKYIVKVEDRYFEVEIADVHARPIIAIVEGDSFEIWPEDVPEPRVVPEKPFYRVEPSSHAELRSTLSGANQPVKNGTGPSTNGSDRMVRAPIPGTIISIQVKAGEEVSIGQELLVLEAMKMKNSIRAPRAGQIKTVFVAPGHSVKHHDDLVEFAE